MCMGMMNYREDNELTTITCNCCSRAWQTTKATAEQFKEQYNSLCNDCRNKSKETVSLLKRKTNNDRINEMSVEEKAEFIAALTQYCDPFDCDDCPLKDLSVCSKDGIKQWLESEAE